VKVGNKIAKSLSHPPSGSDLKEVVWQEDFIIEFDQSAKEDRLEIQVLNTKGALGLFRFKINKALCGEGTWSTAQPGNYPIKDNDRKIIGNLKLRVRREFKILGTLAVDLKEANFEEGVVRADQVMAVLKHTNKVFSIPPANVEGNHVAFQPDCKKFEIDKSSNVFDIFIEFWRSTPGRGIVAGEILAALEPAPTDPTPKKNEKLDPTMRDTMIGQARLPLFDARTPLKTTLPIFTADHKQVGLAHISAQLQDKTSKSA
jgi:hypothetical protein